MRIPEVGDFLLDIKEGLWEVEDVYKTASDTPWPRLYLQMDLNIFPLFKLKPVYDYGEEGAHLCNAVLQRSDLKAYAFVTRKDGEARKKTIKQRERKWLAKNGGAMPY